MKSRIKYIFSIGIILGLITFSVLSIFANAQENNRKPDSATSASAKIQLKGSLIDEHCFALKEPDKDTKMCLNMKKCEASGYGVAVKQSNGKYKFYKFDAAGNVLAKKILKSTKKDKNITIAVTGTVKNNNIKVSNIKES